MKGRVLIVAGSDSGGGAGIQADIKTVTALGGFAMTALTAVTAQNTSGVSRIEYMAPDMVAEQMTMVLDDIGADVIKLGMLGNAGIMEAVGRVLAQHPTIPCVIDPVMVATSGAKLMTADGESALARLYSRCFMLTPNLPELEVLTGKTLSTESEMFEAARALRVSHDIRWVLAKGGHLSGPDVTDILIGAEKFHNYVDTRIHTLHTHGTGCTLASAIATGLAQDYDVNNAVARARAYVRQAILQAPSYGKGTARPMNHLPDAV
ncbi:bifunctional hydroxymethylpyrimidine kinase/phosphomethylpyrimidine kinase [Asaia sp. As-1742]|uniref:bifunctional hydroxymethylpyrimidine kinase/phosphomethylpyrimidine kinase n=1 Tax=Asaia sp. As-1742 TaxID=2608325 RepID=UPI0014203D56|nr:bifunctional hydroxymethylpyrimidine kinase/phosphomethylpyrimidine kinase [Asaia sp. As-1742]NIE78854.1 bifunctional hydroxymethylpyrimidine kinase/phosphomethylpyrimidine kinase [Asaia sp. As-1742]